ncbi:MAG: hypothetical protein IJW73_03365, partial [Candidatus Gastranaerophilales bacterium]|nr:hypothetical protein [Candidatus Gastranaerophilales bacterium]
DKLKENEIVELTKKGVDLSDAIKLLSDANLKERYDDFLNLEVRLELDINELAKWVKYDIKMPEQLERFNFIKTKVDGNGELLANYPDLVAKLSNLPDISAFLDSEDSNKFLYSCNELFAIADNFSPEIKEFEEQLKRFNPIKTKVSRDGVRLADDLSLAAKLSKLPNISAFLDSEDSNKFLYSCNELSVITNNFSPEIKELEEQLKRFNSIKTKVDENNKPLAISLAAKLSKLPNISAFLDSEDNNKFLYSCDELFVIANNFSLDKKEFEEQLERFRKCINKGIEVRIAAKLACDKDYAELLTNGVKRKLTSREAAFFTINTSADTKDISNLSSEVLNKLSTGETKDVFETFAMAKTERIGMEFPEFSEFGLEADKISRSQIVRRYSGNFDFSYNKDNGTLKLIQNDSGNLIFDVQIMGGIINGSRVLFVQNSLNPNENYVLYKGAIGVVDTSWTKLSDEQKQNLIESLKSWANISEKQAEIYADASMNFPFKITQDNGETIIGAGIEGIEKLSINSSKDEVERYFARVLPQLKEKGELTAQNILRLIPKGVDLQINPYITYKKENTPTGVKHGTPINHSISVQWQTLDGKTIEFRTHSADLKCDTAADWIYRFGIDGQYYTINNAGRLLPSNNSRATHQATQGNPFGSSSLIANNIDFQKVMRYISLNYSGNYESIAKELDPSLRSRRDLSDKEIKETILKDCLNNPSNYLKYQGIVEDILEDEGLPSIRMLKMKTNK